MLNRLIAALTGSISVFLAVWLAGFVSQGVTGVRNLTLFGEVAAAVSFLFALAVCGWSGIRRPWLVALVGLGGVLLLYVAIPRIEDKALFAVAAIATYPLLLAIAYGTSRSAFSYWSVQE
ncbi:MAG: hypothetical protein HND43_04455 [Armatimonadetes bacterium]|nr:hypothetical protein [Armatimonadota bacterium]NOG38630.1 hypothetical protein [Armatimonadota bacterium]GIK31163.1 MAG: hypothetical protein BroJett009_01550 [Armatimonadota bacterium]